MRGFSEKGLIRFLPVPVILVLIFPAPHQALAGRQAPGEAFRSALESFRQGDYREAIRLFNKAEKMSVIGDYRLLYLARAYREEGDSGESVKAADRLLRKYPDSPLRQDALRVKIRNAAKGDWDEAIELLSSYVKEFPGDGEMKFTHAEILEKRGRAQQAQAMFREIYLDAGARSAKAYEALSSKEFSPEELLGRAERLMKAKSFKEAESTLRQILEDSHNPVEEPATRGLALSLFMQKKYHEAARLYLKVDNLYLAAKAFLRAGETDNFERTLEALVSRRDAQAVDLLVAKALEKLDGGRAQEALSELAGVSALFPDDSEKAQWYAGWIHYRLNEFAKASEAFSRLYDTYHDEKYLYWEARALEKAGEDSSRLYQGITGDGFYGFLAQKKLGPASAASLKRPLLPSRKGPIADCIKRVDALAGVGLLKEAAVELELLAGRTARLSSLLTMAYKFADLKQYHKAMVVLTRVPESMRPDELLYPLAYWPAIQAASFETGLDPFLLLSLMREESRFDAEAFSPAGAIGLMQLMPSTARLTAGKIRLELTDNGDIYDVETNIRVGAHYLSELIGKFNSVSAALASYNAGEHRVRTWLQEGDYSSPDEFIEDIPFKETRNYVKRIIGSYHRYRQAHDAQQTAALNRL